MRLRRVSLVLLSLAAAAPLFSAQAAARSALPFIEDDYPKAMAEAKSKKLPVFVEAWAPW
jgi:hypothetical protein